MKPQIKTFGEFQKNISHTFSYCEEQWDIDLISRQSKIKKGKRGYFKIEFLGYDCPSGYVEEDNEQKFNTNF